MTKKSSSHCYRKILEDLARYHHAIVVKDDNHLAFKFPCGNSIISWHHVHKITDYLYPDSENDKNKVKTPKAFLDNYISKQLFYKRNTDDFSPDFNDFSLNMIHASSISELKMKLAIALG